MMKTQTFGLVSVLLFFCLSSNAQQLSYYYDASVTQLKGYGYSYNLAINISKSSSGYNITLLKVQPDTKGFLRAGKYYSAAQLGNICPPGDFDRVNVKLRYKYTVAHNGVIQNETNTLIFNSVGDVKTLSKNASDFSIESAVVVYKDDACIAKIKELQNLPKSNVNPPIANSNQKSTEVLVNNPQGQQTSTAASGAAQRSINPGTSSQGVDYNAAWNNQVSQDKQNMNQAVDNFTNTLNQFAQNAREERAAERAQEEQREMRRMQEEAVRRDKITSRYNLVRRFAARDVPTSSKEKAEIIYYFIFACNNLESEYGAVAYVSNVFEIAKSSDGTRPFTAKIKEEIAGITPYNEVLHGYYYSREEAEQALEEFKNTLYGSGVIITGITYKGKPAVANKSDDDFWETGKSKSEKENKKTKSDDFWND